MYLATFHYWINKSGTQGQGRQSPGQNSTDFNFFARVPRQCLGLFAEGAAGSSSVVLHLIVISLSVPCAFINLACSFSLHALTLTNCFRASFSLSFPLSNVICANFAVCMSPVLTAVESLLAASLIRRLAMSWSCDCTVSCCSTGLLRKQQEVVYMVPNCSRCWPSGWLNYSFNYKGFCTCF